MVRGVIRRVISSLNDSDSDVAKTIRNKLGWIAVRGFDSSSFTLDRTEKNLAEVRAVLRDAYRSAGNELRAELARISSIEAVTVGGFLAAAADKSIRYPAVEDLGALIRDRPFQGGRLRDWVQRIYENAAHRVTGAIRTNLVNEANTDQLVRAVVGSRKQSYADGALEIGRQETVRVATAAVSHVVNGTRDEVWKSNGGLVEAIEWSTENDDRVCEICSPRDGLMYDAVTHEPIGHSMPFDAGPGRMHFNDRCTAIPVIRI